MSDLEQVGAGLDGLLRRLGMPAAIDLDKLVGCWEELAGEPWASRATPIGWRDGVLDVEVPDGTTATLLRYETETLRRRLRERLDGLVIDSIRIRVATRKKGL